MWPTIRSKIPTHFGKAYRNMSSTTVGFLCDAILWTKDFSVTSTTNIWNLISRRFTRKMRSTPASFPSLLRCFTLIQIKIWRVSQLQLQLIPMIISKNCTKCFYMVSVPHLLLKLITMPKLSNGFLSCANYFPPTSFEERY